MIPVLIAIFICNFSAAPARPPTNIGGVEFSVDTRKRSVSASSSLSNRISVAMSDDDDRHDPVFARNSTRCWARNSQPAWEDSFLAAMVKLGDSLETAFSSASSRNDVEYERARLIHALTVAFSEFLRENDAPTLYSQRLHRLSIALSDDLNEAKNRSAGGTIFLRQRQRRPDNWGMDWSERMPHSGSSR